MVESTKAIGIAQDALTTSNEVSNASLGKDEFLKLLITQMKNQNPLAPMESQEFAAQLAQFTSVEQLININSTLDHNLNLDLLLTQAINNTLAVSIIGKKVAGLGDEVIFNGNDTKLCFRLDSFAHAVKITIKDSVGNEVQTLQVSDLSAGQQVITWDGRNSMGKQVPSGTYTFTVEATDANGNSVNVQTLIAGIVSGIRYEEGRAILLIEGKELPFSQVLNISGTDEEGAVP